jgi:2Fe-2S ferredoxin
MNGSTEAIAEGPATSRMGETQHDGEHMVTVHFLSPEGERYTIDAAAGTLLMEAAHNNDVPGIIGECGGSMSCATCHVFIQPEFMDVSGEISPFEDDMLDAAATERRENSRLSCQVVLTEAMDGMSVTLPDTQV